MQAAEQKSENAKTAASSISFFSSSEKDKLEKKQTNKQ